MQQPGISRRGLLLGTTAAVASLAVSRNLTAQVPATIVSSNQAYTGKPQAQDATRAERM